MKKDNVKNFIKTHRQEIADDGFNAKLSARLDVCPVLQKTNKKSLYVALIVPAFFLLAVLVIALFGGWEIFISNLKHTRFEGLNLLWFGFAFLLLSLLSWLTTLTVNWKETY